MTATMPRLPFAALSLLLLAISPVVHAQATVGKIVATVNDEAITESDLESRIRLAELATNLPNKPEVHDRLMQQVLRSLVDEQLELQEAKRIGLTAEKSEVDDAFNRLAQQNNVPPEQFRELLARSGIDPRTLDRQLRAQIAWSKVVARMVRPRVDVGEEEVDETLKRINANAGKAQYLVAEIFLAVDSAEQENQVRQLADRLSQEIRQGGNFAAVARQFSQEANAANGGDIGWVQQGQLPPEIDKALGELQTGQMSQPIRTASGYTLVLLREKGTVGQEAQIGTATVDLVQILIPYASKDPNAIGAKIKEAQALKTRFTGNCEAARTYAKGLNDGLSGALGQVRLASLPPAMARVVQPLKDGEVSRPMGAPQGVLLLMSCGRQSDATTGISREMLVNQLGMEKMDLQARRYLRDLRANAYVDIRA